MRESFWDFCSRILTDIKTLFSRTFQDLQRPNSMVFQDSKNAFSRTFRSETWLHEVKKCTHQISFRCNYSISKIRIDPRGDKMHRMYYNEFLLHGAILEPESKIFRTTTLEFQDFFRTYTFSQDFSGSVPTLSFTWLYALPVGRQCTERKSPTLEQRQ